MSRANAQDFKSFPTKEEKDLRSGKIKEMPTRLIYTYHTNFDRRDLSKLWLLHQADSPLDTKGWWSFKTNLSLDDLTAMKEGDRISFLKRMWEIYRYRKSG